MNSDLTISEQNANRFSSESLRQAYQRLFTKRDKAAERKKILEEKRAETELGERNKKIWVDVLIKNLEIVKSREINLAEENRKNKLLEEFIAKSRANRNKVVKALSKDEIS